MVRNFTSEFLYRDKKVPSTISQENFLHKIRHFNIRFVLKCMVVIISKTISGQEFPEGINMTENLLLRSDAFYLEINK